MTDKTQTVERIMAAVAKQADNRLGNEGLAYTHGEVERAVRQTVEALTRQAHVSDDVVVERLQHFEDMLVHADAMSQKPTAPNEVETTKITTRESQLLQRALRDARAALSATNSEAVSELVEAAKASGSALDDWIKLVGTDGGWVRPPTHDEAQAAMATNNTLADILAKLGNRAP